MGMDSLRDKVRNEYVRGSFRGAPISDKIAVARLRWYEHMLRRPNDHIIDRCLSMAYT